MGWDSFLDPTWFIGCTPSAYSPVIMLGIHHPGPRKKEIKNYFIDSLLAAPLD